MSSRIKAARLSGLPVALRHELTEERHKRGWSQADLGQRVGLPQAHISGIESGKIVPRFDTLLDLVRVLDHDLLTIPRALVPAVQAMIRDYRHADRNVDPDDGERPLYAAATHEQEDEQEEDGQ